MSKTYTTPAIAPKGSVVESTKLEPTGPDPDPVDETLRTWPAWL